MTRRRYTRPTCVTDRRSYRLTTPHWQLRLGLGVVCVLFSACSQPFISILVVIFTIIYNSFSLVHSAYYRTPRVFRSSRNHATRISLPPLTTHPKRNMSLRIAVVQFAPKVRSTFYARHKMLIIYPSQIGQVKENIETASKIVAKWVVDPKMEST